MTSTALASPRAVTDVSPRARFDAHVDVARANEHKVHHRWREVMRARRRAETRNAIVREARAHDDVLDERERALEALDANVDEGERAHRREAEAQGRRLAEAETRGEETRRGVEARAVKALATMREGFEDEDRKVSEEWGREVRETLGRAEEARAAFERERDDARATFEDRREEIRNQHGEDVSTMKMMYEHKIEELERELARVTAPSVRRGDLGAADVGEDWTEPLDDARARTTSFARRTRRTRSEWRKSLGTLNVYRAASITGAPRRRRVRRNGRRRTRVESPSAPSSFVDTNLQNPAFARSATRARPRFEKCASRARPPSNNSPKLWNTLDAPSMRSGST